MQLENENFQRKQLIQLKKALYLKHKFSLLVAVFNNYPYRDKLIHKISKIFENCAVLEITRETCPDFETFIEQLASFSKTYELIHVVNNGKRLYKDTIPLFYKGLNYHRESLTKENPVSIILWMLPEDVEDFAANAPDMWSWHGGIFDFEIPAESHEDTTSFPFIRLTPQEREKKQKRITEILDYLNSKPELDDNLKISLKEEIGKLYYDLGSYIEAAKYISACLDLLQKKSDWSEMDRLYKLLESIYWDSDQDEKALETIERYTLLKITPQNPYKILVVDDEPDMKELIEQKFIGRIRSKDWEFVYAGNGFEALEQLQAHPDIYVILLDIRMPGMDGLTFLDRLNAMDRPATKTIMVTAYGDMDNIRKSMNKGAFDFITKRIDFNDLEKTIEKAIKESDIIKDALDARMKLTEYRKELEITARVQNSILPHKFPPYLYAEMQAAREVGGDFYNYVVITKNRIAFYIGDVEGQGLPAALMSLKCATILKILAEQGEHPDECLRILNERLIEERDEETALSVSLFYGLLDLRSGDIEYSWAGKIAVTYIIPKDGPVRQIKNVAGFPLGFFGNRDYDCGRDKLSNGDVICIGTDGVTDAQDVKGASFGDEEKRVIATLKKTVGLPAKETVETFMTDITTFVGDAPQTDDITIMALTMP